MSRGERKAMIAPGHRGLSVSRQCRLLSISRSSFYYARRAESPENLALMRRIDELFLEYPFFGSRQMVRQLRREGVRVGRHRVRRLMRLMGLEAIYQAPRSSAPHPAHRIYPIAAEPDDNPRRSCVVSRHHLHRGAARVPVSGCDHGLGDAPCPGVAAVEHHGCPVLHRGVGRGSSRIRPTEIFNTDQGSQFTGLEFTGVLKGAQIAISMDGRGRCLDNVFIERLACSVRKYCKRTFREDAQRYSGMSTKPVTI